MKKVWIILATVLVLCIGAFGLFTVVNNKNKESKLAQAEKELDPEVIKSIFDLVTEKCYFANVAEGVKTKSVFGIKRKVKYWVEYTESIDIKVDLTKSVFGKKKGDEKTYIIYIPEAEVDEKSATITETGTEIYLENQSWIFPLDVSSSDVEEAIKESNEKTIKDLKENDDILLRARDRAKEQVKANFKAIDLKDKYTIEFVDTMSDYEKKTEGTSVYVYETVKNEDTTKETQ